MTDNRAWLRKQMPRKDDGTPDPVSKAVLVALANFADQSGHCYPSQQKLIEFTGYGESSVARAVKCLEAQGYITRSARRAGGAWSRGRYAGTDYWLELNKEDDDLERNVVQPAALAEHQVTARAGRAKNSRRSDNSEWFLDPVTFEMGDAMQKHYEEHISGRGDEVELLEALATSSPFRRPTLGA